MTDSHNIRNVNWPEVPRYAICRPLPGGSEAVAWAFSVQTARRIALLLDWYDSLSAREKRTLRYEPHRRP